LNIRQKLFLSVLMVFALFNGLKWAKQFYENPYQPLDFRTYYLGSKAFFQGMDPYPDSSQALVWKANSLTEDKWTKETGFPHAVVVYAPQFAWYFSWYQLLNFTTAKWIQFVLNLCSFCLLIFCIKKLQPGLSYTMVIAAIFAFRGSWYALDTGQPMLQVLAFSVFSIYLLEKNQWQTLPALILAFVSFKFTLLIPIVIYMLCTKKTNVFFIYVSLVLILNTLALVVTPAPMDMLSNWRQNIQGLWQYTHSHEILNGLNIISSSLSVALYYFFLIPLDIIQGINTLLLLCGYGLSIYIGRQSPKAAMVFACLTGLCFGHHLVYDLLALIVFLLLLLDSKTLDNFLFFLLAGVMMLPLGSIGKLLDIPGLDLAVPFLLFFYWCFLLKYYLRSRNRVIKNPS
jgi:hypothetical protein